MISNNAGAKALERARDHGIRSLCISPKSYPDRETFNQAFTEQMVELAPNIVVLAGFLVRIPPQMVHTFSNRIVNIHPSLIPSFCGVGYYGLKVHEKVLERGVKVTGATVHFVNEGMDEGPIIAQKPVMIEQGILRRFCRDESWSRRSGYCCPRPSTILPMAGWRSGRVMYISVSAWTSAYTADVRRICP